MMETLLDHDQASMELLRQLFPDTPGLGNEDLPDLGSIPAPKDLNDPDSEGVYWVVPEEDLWRALGYLKFYLYLLEHNAGSIWLPGETPSVGTFTRDDDEILDTDPQTGYPLDYPPQTGYPWNPPKGYAHKL